jgi:hypothetical protein
MLFYYYCIIMEVNAEYQNICIKFKGWCIGVMIPFHESLFTLYIKNKQIFENGL